MKTENELRECCKEILSVLDDHKMTWSEGAIVLESILITITKEANKSCTH